MKNNGLQVLKLLTTYNSVYFMGISLFFINIVFTNGQFSVKTYILHCTSRSMYFAYSLNFSRNLQ